MKGVKLRIVREPELVGRSLFGYAHKRTITLYPDAFGNYELLVKTLGHERTHLYQFSIFGHPQTSAESFLFDEAAYGIENTFWEFYKMNK
ncbi:hypothetical protein [[Flexibacter] sp. ATCC 35208]|uniref:hypothetical protein n=1 Tax=[Flexibacter] sp. ATCC 35208 TaxID=1936242 RepID=UPI0009C79F0C|nr:hypothetical protein [[Flexibacter] sp. ATCC 35208]OMP74690.1 hypothetical protein BW716_34085 [[Flexibacter] sp. ATCC 35208]